MELAGGGVRGDGTWRQNLRTLQQEGHMPEPQVELHFQGKNEKLQWKVFQILL